MTILQIGKMHVSLQQECVVLPNGDAVPVPSGCTDNATVAMLVRAYLQGVYLASQRMTQPNLSAQDIFHLREEFHKLWQEANTHVS